MSAIYDQIFIFSPNDSSSKTIKERFLFRQESSFYSQDIQIFHTFQIQKDKWKRNNLCHEFTDVIFWNNSKTTLYYTIKLSQIIHN